MSNYVSKFYHYNQAVLVITQSKHVSCLPTEFFTSLYSYTEIQNYKYCFLNNRSRDYFQYTSGTLETIVEETDEESNDEVAIDGVLEDQSVMIAELPSSESELPSSDPVVFMKVGETNNAVSQFIGDNIDLNIVSIHGNTPFHLMGLIPVTSLAPPLPDPQTAAAFPRVKLEALD